MNNIINYGKLDQTWPFLPDLLNNSIKPISWQLINIIPKKLYAKTKDKLSDQFWEIAQK